MITLKVADADASMRMSRACSHNWRAVSVVELHVTPTSTGRGVMDNNWHPRSFLTSLACCNSCVDVAKSDGYMYSLKRADSRFTLSNQIGLQSSLSSPVPSVKSYAQSDEQESSFGQFQYGICRYPISSK